MTDWVVWSVSYGIAAEGFSCVMLVVCLDARIGHKHVFLCGVGSVVCAKFDIINDPQCGCGAVVIRPNGETDFPWGVCVGSNIVV